MLCCKKSINYKHVYHYTTTEAFYSIIGKNELWLSNRNSMNDVYDETYIKNIVKKMLVKRHPDLFKGSYFDTSFISDKPQYVFSTSTEKDVAHQWLNYGNSNAICIEFDTKKLDDFFKKYSSIKYIKGNHIFEDDFFSSPVTYSKDEVFKKAKKYASKYEKVILEDFRNITSRHSTEHEIAKMDFHKFYSCVKQDKFYAENEYRFLIFSKKELEHRIRGNRIISFLNVHIAKQALPITGIIISPYVDSKILNDYSDILQNYLNNNKYCCVKVVQSKLSLRK